MRKIISLCVAMGASFPVAAVELGDSGVELYGSLRVMLENAESAEDDLKFRDASSRVGIKGSTDIGQGITAFAHYEVSIDLDNNDSIGDMRYGYIGFKHDNYGAVSIGKVDSPFYQAVAVPIDYMWWNTAPVYNTLDSEFRVSEAIHYASPDLNGLNVKALIQVDDPNGSNKEEYEVAASYAIGDITIGAGFSDKIDGNNVSGVSVSYSSESFYANGAYFNRDNVGSGVDAILGLPSGKNLYTLGLSDLSDEGDNDFTSVILAYQRNIHEQFVMWAEFMAWDGSLYAVEDSSQLNVGLNFNF